MTSPAAIEELCRRLHRRNPLSVADRADVTYDLAEGAYTLRFVGRVARIWPKEAVGLWAESQPPRPLRPLQLRIALTYLLTAQDDAVVEEWAPVTAARPETVRALEAAFGPDAAALIRAARRLGGRRSQVGEAAVQLYLLPRIRLRVILQEPADASAARCLLECNPGAERHLPADMMAALLDMAATRLIDAAQ
jgi:hypothetical protein